MLSQVGDGVLSHWQLWHCCRVRIGSVCLSFEKSKWEIIKPGRETKHTTYLHKTSHWWINHSQPVTSAQCRYESRIRGLRIWNSSRSRSQSLWLQSFLWARPMFARRNSKLALVRRRLRPHPLREGSLFSRAKEEWVCQRQLCHWMRPFHFVPRCREHWRQRPLASHSYHSWCGTVSTAAWGATRGRSCIRQVMSPNDSLWVDCKPSLPLQMPQLVSLVLYLSETSVLSCEPVDSGIVREDCQDKPWISCTVLLLCFARCTWVMACQSAGSVLLSNLWVWIHSWSIRCRRATLWADCMSTSIFSAFSF